MNEMKLNYENFDDLSAEHAAMLAFLDRLEKAGALPPSWGEFTWLLGTHHHEKEEEFLFPLLLGSSRLEVGGPKCMTFFTPRVIGGTGWEDSAARLKRLVSGEALREHEKNSLRERALGLNSMLKIPLEDHVLGARAIAAIESESDAAKRAELISAFSSLLRDHIQREDECLFELCRQALTPEQKNTYASKAKAFDLQHGTRELLARVSIGTKAV